MWQKKTYRRSDISQPAPESMTVQQRHQVLAHSILAEYRPPPSIKGCALHPKASSRCRQCQAILTQSPPTPNSPDCYTLPQQLPTVLRLANTNLKHIFTQKHILNIEHCEAYTRTLKPCKSVKEWSRLVPTHEISLAAYLNQDTPSLFLVLLYRLVELRPTYDQLLILLKANNVNVRCLALLYTRCEIAPEDIFPFLATNLLCLKLINAEWTIREYVLRLMDGDRLDHSGLRLPRLPFKIQKAFDAKRIQLQTDWQASMQEAEPELDDQLGEQLHHSQTMSQPHPSIACPPHISHSSVLPAHEESTNLASDFHPRQIEIGPIHSPSSAFPYSPTPPQSCVQGKTNDDNANEHVRSRSRDHRHQHPTRNMLPNSRQQTAKTTDFYPHTDRLLSSSGDPLPQSSKNTLPQSSNHPLSQASSSEYPLSQLCSLRQKVKQLRQLASSRVSTSENVSTAVDDFPSEAAKLALLQQYQAKHTQNEPDALPKFEDSDEEIFI